MTHSPSATANDSRTTVPFTRLADYLETHAPSPLRLHLACGGVRLRGFVNVDLHPHDPTTSDTSRSGCVADALADIRQLDLANDSVDEMFCSHALEHFVRWEALAMLEDWHRMLKHGGRLVIETPDFWRCVFWLFHPRAARRRVARNQFYGNQWDRLHYETHRYVWSGRELCRALRHDVGFRSVTLSHRTQTHYPGRDMRVTAVK